MIGATQPAAVLGPRSLSPLTPRDRQSRRARSWTSEVFDRIASAREHTPLTPPLRKGERRWRATLFSPPCEGRAGPRGGSEGWGAGGYSLAQAFARTKSERHPC